MSTDTTRERSLNFIEEIIEADMASGKHDGRVHTRFPPEPNGYLHIGHCKAITINFELAKQYGGRTNLRFDDTNPATEDTEYVDSIKADIEWLGYRWDEEHFASDYFPQLYAFAVELIEKGLAYVDDSTPEEIAAQKGTPTEPGTESPYRNRSVAENLDLFERMKNGEFADGSRVLRAKGDMSSPNMHMRDSLMYRIKRATHHRTGDEWVIYPMYDFAHGQSDSIEHITHSLCSLEFRHHRPLYNWYIEQLGIFPSRQIEFARMNVAYLITSKRKLKGLVDRGTVTGWDDPRMPTIAGMRRRGYPAAALRTFCDKAGVARRENLIEYELLEFCVRNALNELAERRMAVLDPLKIVVTNYPEDELEYLPAINNPQQEDTGTRDITFGRELYIERKDFREEANRKYFGMSVGRDVRLKHAYILHCESIVKDKRGNVVEAHCTYYKDSKSGSDTSGRKPKGTLHYVEATTAVLAEMRLYDKLFTDPTPTEHPDRDFAEFVNPDSLKVIQGLVEPAAARAAPGSYLQFLRNGYFCVDRDSTAEQPIFNATVNLKSSYKG